MNCPAVLSLERYILKCATLIDFFFMSQWVKTVTLFCAMYNCDGKFQNHFREAHSTNA